MEVKYEKDRSGGQGHCWRIEDDIPSDILDELDCWRIEDVPEPGDVYIATNGQHYRIH